MTAAGVMVSLCDRSGIMAVPWATAGYKCWCVDIAQPNPRHEAGIEFVRADVREWTPPFAADFVSAFPPCDDLAVSGARWFAAKGEARFHSALSLVRYCWQRAAALSDCWMLENPVSRLAIAWRPSDYIFDPCDYAGWLSGVEELAEQYTKRTCLWTSSTFQMPTPKSRIAIHGSKMWRLPPSPDRKFLRSVTPRGFALAVYVANAPNATALADLDW